MKLTDGEKLIAAMLADLMKSLKVKGEIDPDFVEHAIYHSDLWAVEWKYPGLFIDEEPSEEIVLETTKIMTMCRVVETSIADLEDDDKAEIPEEDRQVFIGFDGNEEPHHYVAKTLIEQLNRYKEFADRDLNSHHSTLDRYQAMLAAYNDVKNDPGDFSLDDIKIILAASNKA